MRSAASDKFFDELKEQNQNFNPEEWDEYVDNLVKEFAAEDMAESIVEDLEEEQAEEAEEAAGGEEWVRADDSMFDIRRRSFALPLHAWL